MWEGWKAGFMAFHAFHTLSFPWPALGAGSECEVAEIPVFVNFAAHFTLRSCHLTLRLPVNLQNPRKIVPNGRPLEVLQSAEKRRLNLICGAVPEGVDYEIGLARRTHRACCVQNAAKR